MAFGTITDTLKTDIAHVKDFLATSSGDLGTITGLANYKRALFHRLITVPGSLAHRPLYGVGIGRYQNGLSSFTMQQKLAGLIQDQFEQDPRTQSVTGVNISSEDGTPQRTVIAVRVIPTGYTEQLMLFTPFGDVNS